MEKYKNQCQFQDKVKKMNDTELLNEYDIELATATMLSSAGMPDQVSNYKLLDIRKEILDRLQGSRA